MTDKPDMPEQTGPNPKSTKGCGFDDTIALLVLGGMLIFVVGVVVVHETRFDEGELILTGNGCKVLRYHRVELDPVDGESLCRVQAKYRIHLSAERFGTLRVNTPDGRIDIDFPGTEVVSKASYGSRRTTR